MATYLPEGYRTQCASAANFHTIASVRDAMLSRQILESRALVCDAGHNLIVDLGCMKGMIPREECAIGIREGTTRDIAILSKVNKPVCFRITDVRADEKFRPYALLSRREVQEECKEHYLSSLKPGDIIRGKITHMESFGCFVDIGCGVIALLPIDAISVSRISHPRDRFFTGQNIFTIVRAIEPDGRISLSHKELLGTWEENAALFSPGETVGGIIRSVESYGVFVELTPNLAGLAECKEGVKVGQHASVFIKSLIPERMKVKLILVDTFDSDEPPAPLSYHLKEGHLDRFIYSPSVSSKTVETVFNLPAAAPAVACSAGVQRSAT